MARLYADENFVYAAVEELRRLGHDVVTVQEQGQSGDSDFNVLQWAISENRAVLTYNRKDFIYLHKRFLNHAGIIVCTWDADFIGQAGRIHQIINEYENLENQLLRINRPPK